MAVPELLRGESKLDALIKSLALANYTIGITSNPKVFLPQYQRSLTDEINRTVLDIFVAAWTANNIVVKRKADFAMRRGLQDRSVRQCTVLLALIQLAAKTFHLRGTRVKFWGERTLQARTLLRAWRDADYRRYGKLLE